MVPVHLYARQTDILELRSPLAGAQGSAMIPLDLHRRYEEALKEASNAAQAIINHVKMNGGTVPWPLPGSAPAPIVQSPKKSAVRRVQAPWQLAPDQVFKSEAQAS